jgi:hypothetical protein
VSTSFDLDTWLEQLRSRGIQLWVERDRLRCNAPSETLTDDLRERLRRWRQPLIARLQRAPLASSPGRLSPDSLRMHLTLGQRGLLPFARAFEASSTYNIALGFELGGTLQVAALTDALLALESRHAALRLRFPPDAEQSGIAELRPIGSSTGMAYSSALAETSVRESHSGGDVLPAALSSLQIEVDRPFSISTGPLWRAIVLQLGDQRHALALIFHHLVFDGFSRDVLLSDLSRAYDAMLLGKLPEAWSLDAQPGDIARREVQAMAGERGSRARGWWANRFSTPVPPVCVPGAPSSSAARVVRCVELELEQAHTLRLESTAREWQVSMTAVAVSACALLLHRLTSQTELLVCAALNGRDHPDSLRMVGHFNTLAPLRIRILPESDLRALAQHSQEELLGAADHRHVPLNEIAALPGLRNTPLNRVLVSYQGASARPLSLSGLVCRPLPLRRSSADFDLAFQFERAEQYLRVRIDYDSGKVSPDIAARLQPLLSESLQHFNSRQEAVAASVSPHEQTPQRVRALLLRHPQVGDAFCGFNSSSAKLVVWLVLVENANLNMAGLRGWMGEHLQPWQLPASMQILAALPRLPDGRVDASALPEPLDPLRTLPEDFAAPESPLERTIAEIWQRVLWLERPVARSDGFSALGGHSLLVVQMLGEVERAIGRRLPGEAFSQLHSLAAFARTLQATEGTAADGVDRMPGNDERISSEVVNGLQRYIATWSGSRIRAEALIVGLNTTGSRSPLFWCLQNEYELKQLAKYLGQEQPVYGMRSGHLVMNKSEENIQKLARAYAEEITEIHPCGAILVGGNCQAALIALQAAMHLRSLGREVPLLIMHEKLAPHAYAGRVAFTFGRDSTRNPFLHSEDPVAYIAGYLGAPFSLDLVSGKHGQFFQEPNIQDLSKTVQLRINEAFNPVTGLSP